jgi:hypothetical protein
MALDIVVTTSRWKNDPISRSLVGFLQQQQVDLGLSDGVVYYDFPAYTDYEASVFRPDLLLLSPSHGFVAIRAFDPGVSEQPREDLRRLVSAHCVLAGHDAFVEVGAQARHGVGEAAHADANERALFCPGQLFFTALHVGERPDVIAFA